MKPIIPPVTNWSVRVRAKMYRPASNSAGKFSLGIGYIDGVSAQPSAASGNIVFDVANYATSAWHDLEAFAYPSGYSTGGPVIGVVKIESPMVGDHVYLSGLYVDEYANSPGVPQRTASGAYVLSAGDNGRQIFISTGGVTISPNSSVALPPDFICTIVNNSGSTQTLTQGAGVTLRKAGTTTTGNLTIPIRGVVTVLKVGTDEYFATGTA